MLGMKIIIYSFIFLLSSLIGILISKKYINRVNELKEFKNALNIFKTKIRYTYEPIPEIFNEISNNVNSSISEVFKQAALKMNILTAGEAWGLALKMNTLNINEEDRTALNNLSKLLGKTDLQGQLNQIEMTSDFLEEQIKKAEKEKSKNEKLYRTLGMILGMAIVIILM
ncbi:MAG: stage III sporulation protein AB [Clostridia bacterium]|nr:stage III sporulation protein AB [Clostridia bacterium]